VIADKADSLIGTMLGKNYRVIERIGAGGMAAVYLVEHQTLLKRFAAKVLSSDLASSLEARARFTQEAHAASQLDHENIVTITDFGVTGDHRPFFVMELLRGQTLDQRLTEGSMMIEEVVAVAVPVARALAHAHAESVVHRDVKPENIFLVQRSQGRWGVKVVDFGIAKTPVTPKLTRLGETLGSPLFMAPEMIRGDENIDQRVDVYSFGVVLFLMLCGRLPFVDNDLLKVMHMHLSSPPPAPRSVNPGLSVELAEIVDRALAKHPDDRYPSMDALLVDLEAALPTGSDRMLIEAQSGASLHETPFAGALAMSRTGQRPVALPHSQRTSAVLPTAPPRSRTPIIVAVAAVAVAIVGAAGWYQLGVRSARNDAAALTSRATPSTVAAAPAVAAPPTAGAPAVAAAPAPDHPVVAAAGAGEITADHETAAAASHDEAGAATERAPPPAAATSQTAPADTAPAQGAAAAKLIEATPSNTRVAGAVPATTRSLRVATLAPLQSPRAGGRGLPGKKPVPPRAPLRRGQKAPATSAVAIPVSDPAEADSAPADDAAAAANQLAPATEAARVATDAAGSAAPPIAASTSSATSPPAAPSSAGSAAPTIAIAAPAAAAPPAAPGAAKPAQNAPTPAPGTQSATAPAAPAIAKPAAPAPSAPAAPRALDAVPELTSFDLQGSLPSSVARRSVERVLPALRACYAAAARAGHTAPAIDLRLSFEIDENSLATHVGLGDVRFGTFSRCAAGVASEIHTPQAPDVGTARVTAVIKFRPL
jgi:eukaryotic-like serine/threonine-protein kinase